VSSDLSRHSPKLRQTGLRRVLRAQISFFLRHWRYHL
jgi:hypothetical protein